MLSGFVLMGIAFPNLASASQQAATSSTGCAIGGWTDTVTVTNSPDASAGEAVISGTGTALDGSTLAAGGGSQTIVLNEPFSVASVTVAGTLSWSSSKFIAPIVTVATQPSDCGGAAPAAAPKVADDNAASSSAADQGAADQNAVTSSAADQGPASSSAADQNAPALNAAADPNAAAEKVYVCKYVGTPGVDEVLQTGQNPIDVSVNAIGEDPVVVGSYFNDQQGRSFVLAFDTGQTPPTRADCPGGSPSTSTVTVTSPVTSTVTVTNPVTVTVTESGPTVTVTNATTVSVPTTITVGEPGPTVTVTQQLEGTTSTVTETVTAAVAGTSTSAGPAVVTVTKVNCPPGSAVQGGSLAFTGTGNDATMSLIGGALAAGGAVCLFMSRKRREPRTH